MPITAKELAKMLNLTPAAVSMALNGRPGVSDQTRKLIVETAEAHGYDFSRLSRKHAPGGSVNFIIYRRQGAVVGDTPFFAQLSEGIEATCKRFQLRLQINYLYRSDDIELQLRDIIYGGSRGIILLGTEMARDDYRLFEKLPIPLVLLDVYFDFARRDCVLINNVQGAYIATDYLISKTQKQPGYLHSSYSISNFEERADGFYKAVRQHGMSTSKSIVHRLSPSVEGAFADMTGILESGEETAPCYFADNDLIAIGAMRALAAKGKRIPEDVAIIGFDDISTASYIDPPLTTINVPKQYMGEMAIRRLLEIIENRNSPPLKIEVGTTLVKRHSVV